MPDQTTTDSLTVKEAIERLNDGECYIVPESDYGLSEIWLKNDTYFLFSIPMFGGTPKYEKDFSKHQINELIKTIDLWT